MGNRNYGAQKAYEDWCSEAVIPSTLCLNINVGRWSMTFEFLPLQLCCLALSALSAYSTT